MHEITERLGVEYATRDGSSLELDIYAPDGAERAPAVLYFHGGAWVTGHRSDFADTRLKPLAHRGIVVVSASYRFRPSATWPAQLDDAKNAFRWLLDHAAPLGVDPDRIGVWGSSAGGQIAAMLALTGGLPVRSAVVWFGPSDLVRISAMPRHPEAVMPPWFDPGRGGPPSELGLVGAETYDEAGEALAAASPQHHTAQAAAAPPFLLVHGDRDPVVPSEQSLLFHDALIRGGGSSTLVLVGGATHEDAKLESPAVLDLIARFVSNGPEGHPS